MDLAAVGISQAGHEPKPAIRITALRGGALVEDLGLDALPDLLNDPKPRVWVDLTDPSAADVRAVAAALGIHPLIVEDISESNERAKVEHIDEVIHLVLFALTRNDEIQPDELDFVLGKAFLVSVHPGSWDPRSAHQLRAGLAPTLERGPDFLLWALVDAVVDGYFPIFDRLADEIDDLQDRVIARPDPQTLQQVFRMKRELTR